MTYSLRQTYGLVVEAHGAAFDARATRVQGVPAITLHPRGGMHDRWATVDPSTGHVLQLDPNRAWSPGELAALARAAHELAIDPARREDLRGPAVAP